MLEQSARCVEHHLGLLQGDAPGVVELQAARLSIEELGAEKGFELFDLLADGRLAHAELFGCATQRPFQRHDVEVVQVIEVGILHRLATSMSRVRLGASCAG